MSGVLRYGVRLDPRRECRSSSAKKVNEVFDKRANVIAKVFDEGKTAGLFGRNLESRLLAFSIRS